MSQEYTIKFGLFKKPDFKSIVEDWQSQNKKVDVQFSGEDVAFFFGDGSVRGVRLKKEAEKEYNLRVNHCISMQDAEIARSLLYSLLTNHKATVLAESNEKITTNNLSVSTFSTEMLPNAAGLLFSIIDEGNQENLSLPVWDADIVVWKSDIDAIKNDSEANQKLTELLQKRAKTLMDAFRASPFLLMKKYTMMSWGYMDTILTKVDFIALMDKTDENNKSIALIPWDIFINFDTIGIEDISPGCKIENEKKYLVYGIPDDEISSIYNELKVHHVDVKNI